MPRAGAKLRGVLPSQSKYSHGCRFTAIFTDIKIEKALYYDCRYMRARY
jgi:hypothetical protein